MQENKVPTIKEIANRLKVSVSTVSRALSDHPRIGLRTKTQVKDLAKELGYEPNSQAIFFKQKKTFVIGVILPFIREEFFSEAISGIETTAIDHSYTILFGQSHDDPEREKQVIAIMKRQRVDGLIISLSKQTNNYEHLQSLEKYGIPIVYFDRVPPFEQANKVYCNLYKGTIEMVSWLFSKGYRRIAFLNGPEKMKASKERFDGYMEGISRQKLKVNMQMVERTDLSKASTCEATEKLLSLKQPPNAIITFNDYVHMDSVQYAHQRGIAVNKEIAFVSYANLPITNYTAYPPLMSLEQFPIVQGEKAMQLMIKLLNKKQSNSSDQPQYYSEEISPSLVSYQQLQ